MNKKKGICFVILVLTVIIIFIAFNRYRNRVQNNIIKIVNNNNVLKGREVEFDGLKLSDATSFEWDYVVIYYMQGSRQKTMDYLGLGYTHPQLWDMSSGFVFVKDKEIVHYEELSSGKHFATSKRVIIYPYKSGIENDDVCRLTVDEAVFKVKMITSSDEKYYYLSISDTSGYEGYLSDELD